MKGTNAAKGLNVRLDERRGSTWSINPASGNAVRSQPRATEREIEVCAQCHARRGQIAEGYEAGKPFLDYYRPALLTSPLYHADGQQRDEVYNWGSFLQSKMYANGVTCSDCHNPHSGKVRAEGNTLCATCHLPSKYDTATHHHHKPAAPAPLASAATCRRLTTWSSIPARSQPARAPAGSIRKARHAKRVHWLSHEPRRALGGSAGQEWYGHEPQGYQRFAAAFAAADAEALDGQEQLRAIAGIRRSLPSFARRRWRNSTLRRAGPRSTLLQRLARSESAGPARGTAVTCQRAAERRVPLAAPLLSDQ